VVLKGFKRNPPPQPHQTLSSHPVFLQTMLTDKIRLSGPESNDPEDILSSSLGVIFPDDITNQHGDASNSVIYLSPAFGPITLTLADPQGEDSRKLFSHFLWNAGLQLAEFIEEGDVQGRDWSVEGDTVLELGAGTGLAGLVAGLKGAREVVITDYPAPEVLGNIRDNVERNVLSRKDKTGVGEVRVEGHEWGVLDDTFAKENKESFGRILVADCLWMPWQHENLLRSIRWFLKMDGRVWVVAGFHTGRAKMRGFYEKSALRETGLEIERIWERNAEGLEREWVMDRGVEDVTERKRWLVIGILKRAG
jgi:EEF1A N-terminal glycine/lysine methyltransferase